MDAERRFWPAASCALSQSRWHGGAPGNFMTHIAITEGPTACDGRDIGIA
jgi:hypothetical protein